MAPILVFTTEEVWLERYPGKKSSVHLLEMPETPKNWIDPSLNSKWLNIKKVRKVVTGAIEVERKNKKIGSSLEAFPYVYINDKSLFSDVNSVEFSDVCITSDIKLIQNSCEKDSFAVEEINNVSVLINKAKGEKCERCWKITKSTYKQNDQSNLCNRCNNVINL